MKRRSFIGKAAIGLVTFTGAVAATQLFEAVLSETGRRKEAHCPGRSPEISRGYLYLSGRT